MTKKEARKLWVRALRSGKYKQARESLRNGDGYCCLGVACDLYMKHVSHRDAWKSPTLGYSWYKAFGVDSVLPANVRKWLGLETSTGTLKNSIYFNGIKTTKLSWCNDIGMDFDRIADLIEDDNVMYDS